MGFAKPKNERRSHHRLELDGRAIVFQRGAQVGRYDLHNLSAGGALISGERNLRRGHLVHVLIDLNHGNDPMSVTAAVHDTRYLDSVDSSNAEIGTALSFPTLSPDQEDAIQDAVLRSLIHDEHAERLPILIYEPEPRIRRELECEIRGFGCSVESHADIAEIVRALEDDDAQYAGLVVHASATDHSMIEVIEFFAGQEGVPTVILPRPGNGQNKAIRHLARLPKVQAPRVWSRDSLQEALLSHLHAGAHGNGHT